MADNFTSFGRGIHLGSITADPSNPKAGDYYYNSTSNVFRFYNGSTWAAMGGGGAASTRRVRDGALARRQCQ